MTGLNWKVRERRNEFGELLDCFVEAPQNDNMPYALEVLGDDYTGYGDIVAKLKHCQMIVDWANSEPAAYLTIGAGLSVSGSIEALNRVQHYMMVDSEHPIEKEDVRKGLAKALQEAEAKINKIYRERLIAAVGMAKMAIEAGYAAGLGRDITKEEGWDIVLYVDTPAGQVSWHIAKDDLDLVVDVPAYTGKWDGTFYSRTGEANQWDAKAPADNEPGIINNYVVDKATTDALPLLAAHALNGMLAHAQRYRPRDGTSRNWHEAIAEEAVQLAKALEKELNNA